MFSRFEWMVALRYLRSRRREGFISVIAWFSLLGIGLGVATLIIVMSVMNGFRHDLLSRILGLNGHVTVYAYARAFTDYDAVAQRIQALPGVNAVTPTIADQVMATGEVGAKGAMVRGVRPEDFQNTLVANKIITGDVSSFGDKNGVIIGDRLAVNLGIGVGDSITLISPKGRETAFGTMPRMKSYRVIATFNVGMYEYDMAFVFMPLSAAQLYFQLPGAVRYLDVTIDDPDLAEFTALQISREIEDTTPISWQQRNSSYFNALQVERNVMFLILTLIILVAAFNIIAGLIMLVKDKGRNIAILRTMGATRGMIMRVFLISGASIGIIGTVGGFIIGILFCENIETIRQGIQYFTGAQLFAPEIYFLSQLPAKVNPVEVATVVGMGIGLSLAATVYPSWRASRLDPVEALRWE